MIDLSTLPTRLAVAFKEYLDEVVTLNALTQIKGPTASSVMRQRLKSIQSIAALRWVQTHSDMPWGNSVEREHAIAIHNLNGLDSLDLAKKVIQYLPQHWYWPEVISFSTHVCDKIGIQSVMPTLGLFPLQGVLNKHRELHLNRDALPADRWWSLINQLYDLDCANNAIPKMGSLYGAVEFYMTRSLWYDVKQVIHEGKLIE